VTVSKAQYFAECALDATRGEAAAQQDGQWQRAFAPAGAPLPPPGSNLVAVVRKLWAAKPNSGNSGKPEARGPGDRPDTLCVRGLPAKWFEVDTALVGSEADEADGDDDEHDEAGSGDEQQGASAAGGGFGAAKARAASASLRKEQRAANVKTLQWAFSRFGTVANLEVVPASQTPEASGGGSGGGA
jgi:hypothetical protein